MKTNELRGKVVALYGSVSRFAEVLGWSKRKTSYIVSGRQEPSGKDIEQMAIALKVEIPDELHSLFFA